MRKNDLQNLPTNEEFMEAYAQRKVNFEKIELRWDSVEHFVIDLQKNNLLKIEDSSASPLFSIFGKKLI